MNRHYLIKTELLDKQANKESRQLEVIKNSIMKRFKMNEINALTISLDIFDDLKEGQILI